MWGHSWEFENNWERAARLYSRLAGLTDVWYATNIELWDYERARLNVVVAANKRSAFNPSALPVWLLVDGVLCEVPGGQTVRF